MSNFIYLTLSTSVELCSNCFYKKYVWVQEPSIFTGKQKRTKGFHSKKQMLHANSSLALFIICGPRQGPTQVPSFLKFQPKNTPIKHCLFKFLEFFFCSKLVTEIRGR